MKRSFCEAAAQRDGGNMAALLQAAGSQLRALREQRDTDGHVCDSCAGQLIQQHCSMLHQMALMDEQVAAYVIKHAPQALSSGCTLFARAKGAVATDEPLFGVLLGSATRASATGADRTGRTTLTALLLSKSKPEQAARTDSAVPSGSSIRSVADGFAVELSRLSLADVAAICKPRLKLDRILVESSVGGKRLSPEPRLLSSCVQQLRALVEGHVEGEGREPDCTSASLVSNPAKDLKLGDIDFVKLLEQRAATSAALSASPCGRCPFFRPRMAVAATERRLEQAVSSLRVSTSEQSMALMPEFNKRIAVLKQLGYIDAAEGVLLKGRVACEVTQEDQLVGGKSLIVTELIFQNVLSDLSEAEVVGLLSALIFQERVDPATLAPMAPGLSAACDRLEEITMAMATAQIDEGIAIEPAEYMQELLHFGLCSVAFEWASGLQFVDVCQMTEVMEGSIVRCITRLDEMCRMVRNGALVVGDTALYEKMERASAAIKR